MTRAQAWLARQGLPVPRETLAVADAIAAQDRVLLARARALQEETEALLVQAQEGRDLLAEIVRRRGR